MVYANDVQAQKPRLSDILCCLKRLKLGDSQPRTGECDAHLVSTPGRKF